MSSKDNNSTTKVVYNIVERGEKSFWNRVGTAFVNRDGSYNVVLSSLPLDGKLHIRDPKPASEAGASTARAASGLSARGRFCSCQIGPALNPRYRRSSLGTGVPRTQTPGPKRQ